MGDIAVDIFLETLKQLITNTKLRLIIGEKHQLQSLEKEIKYLSEFLKGTEKKRNEHIEVMNLVRQIRDVVFESENTVELFVSRAYKQDSLSGCNKFFKWFRWDRFRELFLYKLLCNDQDDSLHYERVNINSLDLESVDNFQDDLLSLDLESVNKEIKTLTAKVKQMYDKNMYDINGTTVKELKHSFTGSSGSGGSSSSKGTNTSKVVEEKVMVGFEDEVKKLMGKLHDSGEGGRLEIISIIGIGGGGKTTLAREVYNRPLTSQKFEIRAWTNISQDYHKTMKRNLLISILKSDSLEKYEDYKNSSEDELGEKVHKCLKGRKYLIVMDDIWDIEAWNDIQRSFPNECKGSKVLLTSRLPVKPDSVPYVAHWLKLLPETCSWELLQQKVFGKKPCPQELVDVGKQIAKKCKGLPLAVVAIAGILATEDKTLDVWEKVFKNLSSIFAKNQEGCMEILELSYNHLPLHLKACFLYIGGHPEDSEIHVRELIWLWIAEGFIQQSDGQKSLEAIAQDYLIGLIDRNLVMAARKSKSHGGIKACRIHDLLRELCLKKAEEDNFLVQNYGVDSISSSATNKHRRLFVGLHFFCKLPPRPYARNIRSFLCLSSLTSSQSRNLSFCVENFPLLRVLQLISAPSLGKIEIEMGDLVHLRYLALSYPNAPNYIHYLSNLETLNFQVSIYDPISLSRHIVKMVKLRHLYTRVGIFEYHVANYEEEEVGNKLDSLQTLHRMCICGHCLRLLKRTPKLRKLGLYRDSGSRILLDILLDLEFLNCLEILYVECFQVRLKLPPTLTRLSLQFTKLKWEELSIILQTLPSLEVLKLFWIACVGPVWNTSELEEGFPQLKYLKIKSRDIEEWNASEDQFPRLEVLVISSCRKLKGIPVDFANLNELREIKILDSCCSAEESASEILKKQINRRGDDDCLNTTFFHNVWKS